MPNATHAAELSTKLKQMSNQEKVKHWESDNNWRVGSEFECIYEPVGVKEIRRQKNARAMKKHLREMAADWGREDQRPQHPEEGPTCSRSSRGI